MEIRKFDMRVFQVWLLSDKLLWKQLVCQCWVAAPLLLVASWIDCGLHPGAGTGMRRQGMLSRRGRKGGSKAESRRGGTPRAGVCQ